MISVQAFLFVCVYLHIYAHLHTHTKVQTEVVTLRCLAKTGVLFFSISR